MSRRDKKPLAKSRGPGSERVRKSGPSRGRPQGDRPQGRSGKPGGKFAEKAEGRSTFKKTAPRRDDDAHAVAESRAPRRNARPFSEQPEREAAPARFSRPVRASRRDAEDAGAFAGRGPGRATRPDRDDARREERPRRFAERDGMERSRDERPQRARPAAGGKSRERFDEGAPRGGRTPSRVPARTSERFARPMREEPLPVKAAIEPALLPTSVQTVVVTADEDKMRVDRFLEARFPGLSFSHIQRIVRKGELRVNGKRADSKDRLEAGQTVRIPPLKIDAPKATMHMSEAALKTLQALKDMTLFEDADVLVLNKPAGLAVQGGSGTTRHVDQMLEVMRDAKGQKPRLVHRLDKETAGCLLVAKTRFAATALTGSFRHRSARKTYWALVAGVPKPKQGRISTYLAKEESEEDSIMRIAQHGDEGASHAVTYYAVVETSAQKLAWLSLKPVTGRTHQLRAHTAHIGHPIIGDPKYFNKENWEVPGGLQKRLHLLARRIVVPHPRGGVIDVTAPLPPHMLQSWNLLGLEADRFDPIENAPEE